MSSVGDTGILPEGWLPLVAPSVKIEYTALSSANNCVIVHHCVGVLDGKATRDLPMQT